MTIDPSYGPRMAIDAFMNTPSVPPDQLGGWYVRGHDHDDKYQEFVIVGDDWRSIIERTRDWLDWVKIDLAKGDPLLVGD